MLTHEILNLRLTKSQAKTLKAQNLKVLQHLEHLEQRLPLKMAVLKDLQDALSGVVEKNPDWQRVLKSIHDSGDHYCVHLLHPDNEILNLPWSMAVDPVSRQPLGSIRRLYLTKSIPQYFNREANDFPKAPPPLKILIMVSSPEDPGNRAGQDRDKRLSYEEEEYEILKAFAPLMETGEVEIDFTEDGSLEALERKLSAQRFHILHFSGHAVFKEKDNTGSGYLQLENPVNLSPDLVDAYAFAETVNCNAEYKVPMVVLSSCQTAKGSSEKGLTGVTNHLLRSGVPVVVSMGMSIIDYYAAQFSAHFYSQIARRQTILSAFNQAVEHIKEIEYNRMLKDRDMPAVPLQWIIPNLYLSRRVHRLVDPDQAREKLELSSNRYIFEKDLLLLKHEREYLFIGRRKEKARILRPLFEKKPVLLKGQGGVGKTALAEHLVQRLIAANPKTIPFVFNEKIKSIKEILEILENFLRQQGEIQVVSESSRQEKAMDRFIFLVFAIARTYDYQPVFVFDNMEAFQAGFGQEFAEEYSDIKAVIDYLCQGGKFHVILTCRYPVQGFKNLQSFDLDQVGINDFLKKCLYIDVGHIHTYLREAAAGQGHQGVPRPAVLTFMQIVKLLHQTFGGNYRALEFFNQLLRSNPEKIKNALESLEVFREETREAVAEVKERMGQSLLFSRLMALLEPGQQRILDLLSHFRVPVQRMALDLQGCRQKQQEPIDLPPALEHLHRLTLIEISLNRELDAVYYYVTPIVKDLLADYRKQEQREGFSHEQAGIYYYSVFHNMEKSLTPLEEAFYHYDEAGNRDKVREIGAWLSGIYYGYSMFGSAYFYAGRVYELLGDGAGSRVLNLLGLIYKLYGEYDQALNLFQKARSCYQKAGDKAGEGTTLNNIGEIYRVRCDYETALKYLEQSLKISRKIGDKAGEGTTLNNIGEIYRVRVDYETALKYLEQNLKIRQEIGDKAGEGTTLNNISLVYSARGDYETALKYLEQSLKIMQEIGDKSGEGTTLNNISLIYHARGDYETALKYLEQSLKIRQEIGDKAGEDNAFNNIGQIYYAKGEYDTALKYFEQSLNIQREIGNKAGQGSTLNNISQVYDARGDYETALKYLEQSLKISQEIGDKIGQSYTLHNMAGIALQNNDMEKFMEYETTAYQLAMETKNAMGIYHVGRDLGYIMTQQGMKKEGIHLLKQSLEIGKAAGFPNVGEIEKMLGELGSA